MLKDSSLLRPRRTAFRLMPAFCALFLLGSSFAHGAFIIAASEVGSNVVFTGSGSLDTTGLASAGTTLTFAGFYAPDPATLVVGPTSPTLADTYTGLTGPTSFGTGSGAGAVIVGSGYLVGIVPGISTLYLPNGYQSGSLISSSDTYSNQTFSTLGLTPGKYVYSLPNDTITLFIGPSSSVPESGSTFVLGGAAFLLLLGGQRWFRNARMA